MGSNYRCDISKQCVKWRLDGLSIKEIVEKLQGQGVDGWDYMRVKNAVRPNNNRDIAEMLNHSGRLRKNQSAVVHEEKETVKEGATERKPKYELVDGFYTIFYGKNKKLRISESDVDKAFKLYTLGNLTMNQVALELGITRADFYALKSSFSLTKSDLPFTPEKIDAMTADEIAEQTRIEKKRFATKKFEQGKFKDIEAENKKFRELEYWFKLAADRLSAIQPQVFKPMKKTINDNIVRVLTISDIHAGERVDSRWGKFNLDIMRERFKILTEKVINQVEPCELTIFSAGDLGAGRIHPSIVKLSDNFLDSLFAVTESIISMIGTLICHGFKIKLMPIMGNHGSADSAHNARVLAENYERMVEWAIKLKLGEVKQFEMLQPHFNMGLIKIHDYSVVCVHGDQGATKQLADLERLFRHENVREVLAGHLHHQKSEEYCGVTVYHQPSFIGAEHYGIGKGLVSEPGCRLIEYGKEGRLREHYLRF
jgi:hypothetical protein